VILNRLVLYGKSERKECDFLDTTTTTTLSKDEEGLNVIYAIAPITSPGGGDGDALALLAGAGLKPQGLRFLVKLKTQEVQNYQQK